MALVDIKEIFMIRDDFSVVLHRKPYARTDASHLFAGPARWEARKWRSK